MNRNAGRNARKVADYSEWRKSAAKRRISDEIQ
jgi:hypothetical protein